MVDKVLYDHLGGYDPDESGAPNPPGTGSVEVQSLVKDPKEKVISLLH